MFACFEKRENVPSLMELALDQRADEPDIIRQVAPACGRLARSAMHNRLGALTIQVTGLW
jgi:hypothetical protein